MSPDPAAMMFVSCASHGWYRRALLAIILVGKSPQA
jgi:hypothetical protein